MCEDPSKLAELESIIKRDTILFAALLLKRFEPMQSHHSAAIRERLGYKTDTELMTLIEKGIICESN